MKDWIFVWHPKSVPEWNNVNHNLNMIVDFESYLNQTVTDKKELNNLISMIGCHMGHYDINLFANKSEINEKIREAGPEISSAIERVNGQLLNTYEQESFKYSFEKVPPNRVKEKGGHIIIKDHFTPFELLNETNSRVLNLDKISEYLKDNTWVALGTFFDSAREENLNVTNMMAASFFYTRDKDLHSIRNLSGGKHPKWSKYITCVNYAVFKKIGDSDIVLCYTNPNLLSAPHKVEMFQEMGHNVHFLSYGRDIYEFLTRPHIDGGILVNNTIFANSDRVRIDLSGDCDYKYLYRKKPRLSYNVTTNLEYSNVNDVLSIVASKPGYVIIDYNINTYSRFHGDRKRASRYRLEYTIFKD